MAVKNLIKIDKILDKKKFVLVESPSKKLYGMDFMIAIRKEIDDSTFCTLSPEQIDLIIEMRDQYDQEIEYRCEICRVTDHTVRGREEFGRICDPCFREESQ